MSPLGNVPDYPRRVNYRPGNDWGLLCDSGATCDVCGSEGILWYREGLVRCSEHGPAAITPEPRATERYEDP
jgi:hypothetical protein